MLCIAIVVGTVILVYLAIWADNYRRHGRRR